MKICNLLSFKEILFVFLPCFLSDSSSKEMGRQSQLQPENLRSTLDRDPVSRPPTSEVSLPPVFRASRCPSVPPGLKTRQSLTLTPQHKTFLPPYSSSNTHPSADSARGHVTFLTTLAALPPPVTATELHLNPTATLLAPSTTRRCLARTRWSPDSPCPPKMRGTWRRTRRVGAGSSTGIQV